MHLRVSMLALAGALLVGGFLAITAVSSSDRAGSAEPVGQLADVVPPEQGAAAIRRPTPVPDPTPTPIAAPTATPTPLPTAEPEPEPAVAAAAEPVTHADLALRIGALLTDPALPAADRLSVSVVDENGRVLVDHNADEPLLPASTQKLVTAAGALAAFGPDHRFRTEVRATIEPDADGVIDGDLVLVGGGDPALATARFASHANSARPRTPLEGLADRVHAAGVRRVRGRLLGDGSLFTHEPEAPGWPPRYLANDNTTRSSGLTIDAGRRMYASGGRWYSKPAPNPASEAAAALLFLLRDRGIEVDGGPAGTTTPPPTPATIASIDSPRLAELLRYTVQRSDNHMADTIFRALGSVEHDGSWARSAGATRGALESLDLDWAGIVLADGSGLSRLDRLSATFLTSLDVAMAHSSEGEQWGELMAVASRSGTLRRRLNGTVAEGRMIGKTGTLRDVRSLSGMVLGPSVHRYHFAVIGNGLNDGEKAAVRRLQDDLVVLLAEDLYGCEMVPVAEPTDPTDASAPLDGASIEMELRCAA